MLIVPFGSDLLVVTSVRVDGVDLEIVSVLTAVGDFITFW